MTHINPTHGNPDQSRSTRITKINQDQQRSTKFFGLVNAAGTTAVMIQKRSVTSDLLSFSDDPVSLVNWVVTVSKRMHWG